MRSDTREGSETKNVFSLASEQADGGKAEMREMFIKYSALPCIITSFYAV